MTEIRDLIEQRCRELLAAIYTPAPTPLRDMLDDDLDDAGQE